MLNDFVWGGGFTEELGCLFHSFIIEGDSGLITQTAKSALLAACQEFEIQLKLLDLCPAVFVCYTT